MGLMTESEVYAAALAALQKKQGEIDNTPREAHCTANARGTPNYGVRGVGFSQVGGAPAAAAGPLGAPLGAAGGSPGSTTTMVLDIPAFQMRALIGRGGQTINEIRQHAQAHIHITGERLTIHGNVERAQQLIFSVLQKKLPMCFQPPAHVPGQAVQ